MTIFLLLCLVFSISASTVIPIDSHSFSDGQHPKSSDLNVISVDSRTFFNDPKSNVPTVVPVDSQTFFDSEAKPRLTVIPTDSQTFFTDHTKPTVIPVNSQTFFDYEPKPPHVKAFSDTVKHPKPSDLTVIPIDSQTFFTSEPKPPRLDATVSPSKSSGINVMPVDSGTFFSSEPKPPHLDATAPTSESPNAIRFDSEAFLKSEPKYKDSASSARPEMNISIIAGIKNIAGYGQAVVCHKAQYVGFYCHQLGKSSVFAVCHEDTTSWNRNRLAFKILKAKPGDAICHLLPSYDLVWVALR